MRRYFIKKTLIAFFTLFCVATITFFLMHIIPGNPFLDERPLPEEVMASLKKHYGLDKTLWAQYFQYLKGVLHFDLGPSLLFEGKSIQSIISQGFPISCALGCEALFIAISIGFLNGSLAALRSSSKQEKMILLYGVLSNLGAECVRRCCLLYVMSIQRESLPGAR